VKAQRDGTREIACLDCNKNAPNGLVIRYCDASEELVSAYSGGRWKLGQNRKLTPLLKRLRGRYFLVDRPCVWPIFLNALAGSPKVAIMSKESDETEKPGEDDEVTLSISPEQVCFIIVKAREFDVKDRDRKSTRLNSSHDVC
jgi:hypothetical protein